MSANRPALLGGNPVRREPLPSYNTIGDAEKKAVMEVLDSGELSGFIASPGKEFFGGKAVQALEEDFKRFFDIDHAVSVNSATSGLHAAVAACGVGPGDEVIVPPYTMSASATCVLFTGAVPIFADIDDEIFCLDPACVEAAITSRTKAIVAVNLFGHAAPLAQLRSIADKHSLYLIEDNAQAPAARHHNSHTGTIGDFGIFSFNRHKTMQSGEGGVVICHDENLAQKLRLMRNHGEVVVGAMGVVDIVNTTGLNYRMTEMEAAVARVQFGKIEALNERRIALANRITSGLVDLPGLRAPIVRDHCTHVFYFYPIVYDAETAGLPRDLFAAAVQAEGFTLRPGYVKPIYLEPVFQKLLCFGADGFPFNANPRYPDFPYAKGSCPVVERLNDKDLLVTNIIYPPLDETDMDAFIEACAKVIASRDDLLAARASLNL